MKKTRFLTVDDVLAIHSDQIARYGGMRGTRSPDLLLSAVAQPTATFESHLLHKTVFDMAAAYLYHLAKNHPFIDGNKRTSAASTDIFLSLNGYDLRIDDDAFESLIDAAISGHVKKQKIASILRAHCHPTHRT